MSEEYVRQWCCEFRESSSNVDDKKRSGRCSDQTDDLTEYAIAKVKDNHYFRSGDSSIEFPEVSKTALFRIVNYILGYHKLCVQ